MRSMAARQGFTESRTTDQRITGAELRFCSPAATAFWSSSPDDISPKAAKYIRH